jgi:hypothetical protein
MIFEAALFQPGGDRFTEVEFRDDMSFDLNFVAQSKSGAIWREQLRAQSRSAPS